VAGLKHLLLLNILALSILPAQARDGADSSGGGLGVVCLDDTRLVEKIRGGDGLLTDDLIPHLTSIENFDLYEATLLRGLDAPYKQRIIPIKDGESAEQYALRILARLDHAVPALARLIRKTVDELSAPGATTFEARPLEKMTDAEQVGLIDYAHCMLATMGVNRLDEKGSHLTIDSRLFTDEAPQSEQSKGVFKLHEYIYLTARKLGHTDSRRTRELVNMLITEDAQFTVKQFALKLQEFGFSGKQRFQVYPEELLANMAREIAKVAHNEFVKTLDDADALIAKAKCGEKYITPCVSKRSTQNVDELMAFAKARSQRINDAMLAYYAGPKGKALIENAPGLTREARDGMKHFIEKSVIWQIFLRNTDCGLEVPLSMPITEYKSADELADGLMYQYLADPSEDYVDYPLEVVQ
jgi:hypothetical protein